MDVLNASMTLHLFAIQDFLCLASEFTFVLHLTSGSYTLLPIRFTLPLIAVLTDMELVPGIATNGICLDGHYECSMKPDATESGFDGIVHLNSHCQFKVTRALMADLNKINIVIAVQDEHDNHEFVCCKYN